MMPERPQLPTREQINAISNRRDLEAIRDEIQATITKIEVDLEYGDGDDEWAARARAALAFHRNASKAITHRLHALRPTPFEGLGSVKMAVRERADCNPLGLALMEAEIIDADAMSLVEAEAALKTLVAQIEALTSDREDEVLNYEPVARDEGWLIRTGAALRRAKASRHALNVRIAHLRKTEKLAEQERRDAVRPQLFVDAARQVLDRETFLRIWAIVDQLDRAPAGEPA